jgi:hypothetical protein
LNPAALFGRAVAAGAIALVLLLAVMAASPDLHAWVHGQTVAQLQTGHGDDDCVVTQFSHGLPTTTTAFAVVASLCLSAGRLRPYEVVLPPAPRFRLPPLCGPPAA